ncbi:MAG: toll/interleukin-1 receptor domain-containing protein, partial [Hyphomicrobiales bacterium]
MSRIFISHSSSNNAEAIALRDWLVAEGWSDLFLDLDPNRGIAAGERWERALNEAARRCEAVIFLISKAWLGSRWCTNELTLARRLNKRLFGVLVEEGLAVADLPHDVTSTWQLVNLATGRDHRQFRVTLPVTGGEEHVTYSHEGLARLKAGLQRAGLHASYFNWPPETDPKRAPYRGLRPLEADDAGIFFGREAPVIEAIDRLRGLTEAAPPRLMVILGASGAGKSSFLRAGLLPRLGRDPQTFLPLPVIRPERAAISGETGLLSALADAFAANSLKVPRGDLREAIAGGAAAVKPLLARLQSAAQPPDLEGSTKSKLPTLVFAIDQGEELFLAEAQGEAQPFLALLRDLLAADTPAVIAIFTIRSDNYERLQQAQDLADIHKVPLDLGPMPKGSYAEVVKGP